MAEINESNEDMLKMFYYLMHTKGNNMSINYPIKNGNIDNKRILKIATKFDKQYGEKND